MSMILPAASVTEAAYHSLKEVVLSGRVPPGGRLKISDLCNEFGVNLSAMREALTRLAAEGVVAAEPQRGFRAALISREDLLDLTRTRIEIENLCLEKSMRRGDVAWEARVVASSHALSRTPKPLGAADVEGYKQWWRAHHDFHDALVSACGSPWLLRIRDQLNVHSERYLRFSMRIGGQRRAANDEHHAITDGVLKRQHGLVSDLISEHFQVTTDDLLTTMALDDSKVRQVGSR